MKVDTPSPSAYLARHLVLHADPPMTCRALARPGTRRGICRIAPALLLLAFALQGCVLAQTTRGTPISDETIDRIVPGTTTREEVSRLLGAPDDIIYSNLEHDPLFERAFQYERTRRKTTFFTIILFSTARTDTNKDVVVVFFDDEGVVQDVASRLDMDRPRYGTPWGEDAPAETPDESEDQ
jgi:outer membrane protein assembly factor BamE (lipoprotein component of BamABCDE complex)